jgi:hypothetical protein
LTTEDTEDAEGRNKGESRKVRADFRVEISDLRFEIEHFRFPYAFLCVLCVLCG